MRNNSIRRDVIVSASVHKPLTAFKNLGRNVAAVAQKNLFVAFGFTHSDASLRLDKRLCVGGCAASRGIGMTNWQVLGAVRPVLSAAVILGASFTSATFADTSASLRLSLDCGSASQTVCEALKNSLSSRFPHKGLFDVPAGFSPDLEVGLSVTRQDDFFLAGFLTWAQPGTAPVKGPIIELSSIDSKLTPQAANDFARGLLQVTDLPL